MSTNPVRASWTKRILIFVGGLTVFLLLFVLGIRISVFELFRGIESSHATGLSGTAYWDSGSMWMNTDISSPDSSNSNGQSYVSRSADLRTRTSSFDRSVARLHELVSAHNGYFEVLQTENRSGYGRGLSALLAVPSTEFDTALSDLKTLGRIESVSQGGEDSAVKLATTARHLDAMKTNLSRLQKLQRERKGELRDVVALEKDMAQARDAAAEAERKHAELLSTVTLARIHVALIEDYRAPLQTNFAGGLLSVRNSLVDGVGAVFSSISLVFGIVLEFGLPLLFWSALLYWPSRMVWRRFHAKTVPLHAND